MKKYSIIYADPPWKFNNKNTGGSMISGSENKYPCMTVDQICKLPINEITDENCILFMWWVASQPVEALKVVESWGFTLKTMTGFNWVKTTKNDLLDFGMGFWTRAGSELCLIAVKGKPKRKSCGVRSVELFPIEETIFARNEKHSKKPEIFKNRIVELMGDIDRIELFARENSVGWDVYGNEVNNSITLDI